MNLRLTFLSLISCFFLTSATHTTEEVPTEQETEWEQKFRSLSDSINEEDYQEKLEQKRNMPPPSGTVVLFRKVGIVFLLKLLACKQILEQKCTGCKNYIYHKLWANHERQ